MFLKFVFICLLLIGAWSNYVTQDYCWRQYVAGYIPLDALEAAPGKYIGLAWHSKGQLIATIFRDSQIVVAVEDKKVIIKHDVKIFCTSVPTQFYWEPVNFTVSNTELMNGAVRAGYHHKLKSDVFIGRVFDEDEWMIGRVVPIDNRRRRGLWVWNKRGDRKNILFFEMLKFSELHITIPTFPTFPTFPFSFRKSEIVMKAEVEKTGEAKEE